MKRAVNITVLLIAAVAAVLLAARLAGARMHDASPGPLPRDAFDPSLGTNVEVHLAQVATDGNWSVTSFTNDLGMSCSAISVPGHGPSTECADPGSEFSDSPVVVHSGFAQVVGGSPQTPRLQWVWGTVRPGSPIDRLELTLSDCTREPLALDDDYFLYVFSPAQVSAGLGAQTVTALNASGGTLATADARPSSTTALSSC